jgi:hypothetical protein
MQTHTITTYLFDELSDQAKESAIEYVRANFHDLYSWHDDNVNSLKAFGNHFSLSDPDWEVSTCSYSHASASVSDDLEELKGVRLWKYLNNSGLLSDDLLSGNCPFTGFCMDESLLDPIRAFMEKPDQSLNYQELIDTCLAAWVSAYVADWEYTYTDEAIKETIEANEYEFTENGNFY